MHHYFIDFSKKDGRLFTIKKELSEAQFQCIEKSSKRISKLERDDSRIKIVNQSYLELMKVMDNITDDRKNLALRLTAFLACSRKYLDNWQTYIGSTFGKDSKEFKLYKKETAYYYDNVIEYSFMYRLRNFDQHCEFVVSKVIEGLYENGQKYCKVLVSKNMLLNSGFHGWKNIDIDFIEKQDEDFEILPIIKKFYQCLIEIHKKIMTIHFTKDFFSDCVNILNMVKEFDDNDNISVGSTNIPIEDCLNQDRDKNLYYTYIYVGMCKIFLQKLLIQNQSVLRILAIDKRYTKYFGNAVCIVQKNIIKNISPKCKDIYLNDNSIFILLNPNIEFSERQSIIDEFSNYINALLDLSDVNIYYI